MKHKVFISYSSGELRIAEQVCKYLENMRVTCWMAPRDVNPGSNYASQIVQAIRDCSVLVLLASEQTNLSAHVSNEVSLAFDNKKVIIPFKIEDIIFSDEYLYYLGRKHWIEAHKNIDVGLEQLIKTLSNFISIEVDAPQGEGVDSKNEFDSEEILNVSQKFLKRSFRGLSEKCEEEIYALCVKYSKMFSPIIHLTKGNEKLALSGVLVDSLLSIICSSNQEYVLRISGNNGSEKNALMQLIFLRIYCDAINGKNEYIPFYLNVPHYEKRDYSRDESIASQIRKEMEMDLNIFIKKIKQYPNRKPIIFIDGLRDFVFSKTLIEHILAGELSTIKNLQKVVSVDTNLTNNKKRLKKVIALAPQSFEYSAYISALDLADDAACNEFFYAFEDIYHIQVADLHEKLQNMLFYEIDAYMLRLSATTIRDNMYNDSFTITDLYEAICLEMLNGNREALLVAAETAYRFAYTEFEFTDSDVFSFIHWTIIKRHRSFIEFLISYYYVYKLTEFDEDWDINFFEMVLPKEVTRFVTPRLNDSFSNEEKILAFCKKNYYNMGVLGKSEMTFWLGRITNNKLSAEAKNMLRCYYNEMKDTIKERKTNDLYENVNEQKADLFLLRGITVSLIYYGIDQVVSDYISELINDDLTNMINRGFHLEYYGDKPYLPNENILDFEDDINVGEKTFKRLVKNIEKHLSKRSLPPVCKMDLFTMCSLIQARIENPDTVISFSVQEYIIRCINFIERYKAQNRYVGDEKVVIYFNMVYNDFQKYLEKDKLNSVACETYNKYSKAIAIKRTGWVDLDIPDPESIVEHMYNTWLLGMLNLPEKYQEDKYDKNHILNIVMMHDLGETETGDIPKPLKRENPEYEETENLVMKAFLLKGTYPTMPNLREGYLLWEEWVEQKTFNARVAKDLDIIQAIYQFCRYCLLYPEKFTKEKRNNWMNEYQELNTELGLTLYEKIIKNNKLFSKLFPKNQ